MLIEDIKKVNPSKLDDSAKKVYEKLKEKSNNFDPEYLIVYQNLEDAVKEFVDVVKEKYPDAIRIVREKKKKEVPPTPDTDDKEVIEAMRDYNISQEKAERLIKLRKDASESRKESLDKMLDTLRKSEFYGESGTSKIAIDKNRSRDLGKDTNRGSITLKDELRMTGRPFKRISKNGKVYYEYRLNRRDIDHKVRLAKGGITEHGLRRGDTIIDDMFWSNEAVVRDAKGVLRKVDIANGKRYAKGGETKGRGWEGASKGKRINKIDELQVGKVYLMFSPQFNAKNLIRIVSQDPTGLKRPIVYATYVRAGGNEESFAIWDYELKSNEIYTAKEETYAKGGGVEIPNAEKMFHLPYELAVYVPSTKDVDKSITASELRARVKLVEKYLAETFGGFTSSEKVGGYLSSKSSIVTEKVIPVTAFATMDDFRKNKSKLINKMSVWAKEWGQEAIGFEFEGDLYYVPQKFKKGGKLTATYIPKRDIKMLTTVWGNNIKGKDLIDGAYTKRKNIKTAPKMARTMFEEETFEFAKGGTVYAKGKTGRYRIFGEVKGKKPMFYASLNDLKNARQGVEEATEVFKELLPENTKFHVFVVDSKEDREIYENQYAQGGVLGQGIEFEHLGDPMKGEIIEVLDSGDYIVSSGSRTILVTPMNLIALGAKPTNRFGFFKKGGKTKKPMVVRYYFEDDGYEYEHGGGVEEEIDLFEDYENIPDNVQAILDKNMDAFETGNYKGLEKARKAMEKIGYTFDFYLDGQAYNLRPIGSKGKHD